MTTQVNTQTAPDPHADVSDGVAALARLTRRYNRERKHLECCIEVRCRWYFFFT